MKLNEHTIVCPKEETGTLSDTGKGSLWENGGD